MDKQTNIFLSHSCLFIAQTGVVFIVCFVAFCASLYSCVTVMKYFQLKDKHIGSDVHMPTIVNKDCSLQFAVESLANINVRKFLFDINREAHKLWQI